MEIKYAILVMVCGIFITILALGMDAFSKKLSTELIKDMAKMGYYQKEVNGNVLWVKDDK
jgi:hypothetical protein